MRHLLLLFGAWAQRNQTGHAAVPHCAPEPWMAQAGLWQRSGMRSCQSAARAHKHRIRALNSIQAPPRSRLGSPIRRMKSSAARPVPRTRPARHGMPRCAGL